MTDDGPSTYVSPFKFSVGDVVSTYRRPSVKMKIEKALLTCTLDPFYVMEGVDDKFMEAEIFLNSD